MGRGWAAGRFAIPSLYNGAARGAAQATQPQRCAGPFLSPRVSTAGCGRFAYQLEAVVPVDVETYKASAESHTRPGVGPERVGRMALFATLRFGAGCARQLPASV